MPPLTKTCPKMFRPYKGGSLCVKDVFAKKFLVPGEIPLAARSHRFFGNTLVKAGHLMRPSAQRKVPGGHEDEERLTADIIEPCLASTNKSLA